MLGKTSKISPNRCFIERCAFSPSPKLCITCAEPAHGTHMPLQQTIKGKHPLPAKSVLSGFWRTNGCKSLGSVHGSAVFTRRAFKGAPRDLYVSAAEPARGAHVSLQQTIGRFSLAARAHASLTKKAQFYMHDGLPRPPVH